MYQIVSRNLVLLVFLEESKYSNTNNHIGITILVLFAGQSNTS